MKLKTWAVWLLVILMTLTAAAASAGVYPLKKGSKGEEVVKLQMMLYDFGLLDEEPDGIFGRKTQAAVKEWQKYCHTKQTGQISEEAAAELEKKWRMVEGIAGETDIPQEELKKLFSSGCSMTDENNPKHYEYCFRHYRAAGLAELLEKGGMPEKMESDCAKRLADLWLDYIPALYDAWEQALPEAEKYIPREQKADFEAGLEEMREEWMKGKYRMPLTEEALWLNEAGIGLCFDLYTAEENQP